MMEIASTVPEVLDGCAAGFVPVNVAVDDTHVYWTTSAGDTVK